MSARLIPATRHVPSVAVPSHVTVPRWLALAIIPALAAVGFFGAWAADAAANSGEVARNVSLAGDTVGGLGTEDLTTRVEELAAGFSRTPIVVETSEGDIELTAADLGVSIDVPATVEEARRAGRDGSLLTKPFSWFGSLFNERSADVVLAFDPDVARSGLDEVATVRTEPTEPYLDGSSGTLQVVAGAPGQVLDVEGVVAALPDAMARGETPVRVQAAWTDLPPTYSAQDFEPLIAEAARVVDSSAQLKVNEYTTTLPSEVAATWFSSRYGDDGPELVVDEAKAFSDLETLMQPGNENGGGDLIYEVVDGEVSFSASDAGSVCCASDAARVFFEGIDAGLGHDVPIVLPTRVATPDEVKAEAEALGIVEEISTFTTNHKCCQSRVTNIQRMADIVRGAIIRPGETFSLNGYVGRRTRENGFVPGGFIQNGVLTSDIGGGVSQFATTLFNAAFFGGLDFAEYQAHSIYFSRYPLGREATVSFPKPDLKITNNTPYGVLIWPTYTDTSITVTFYSTKIMDVEQTNQTLTYQGQCKRYTTERTRTYLDGRVVVDTVGALYRPGEGRNCDGSPSDPSVTTTTHDDSTTTTEAGGGETTTTVAEGSTTTAAETTTTTTAVETSSTTTTTAAETTTTTSGG